MSTLRLGSVEVEPKTDVTAGSMCTLESSYTVGRLPIGDGGSILVLMRSLCDTERPQLHDPQASAYTTVTTTGKARLEPRYHEACTVYAWRKALQIDVRDGLLEEGDVVQATFGDRSGGSPGIRMQTFPESEYILKVMVDRFGLGRYEHVQNLPFVKVVGGPAEQIQVVAPSDAAEGEAAEVTVRAVDDWGNQSKGYRGRVRFSSSDPAASLPGEYTFKAEDNGVKRFEFTLNTVGLHSVSVEDGDVREAVSNPVVVRRDQPELRLYWGDIHGQTRETCGTGTLDEYFSFARDFAAMDFGGWQGNDYAVTNAFWREVCEASKRFNEPGRYVAFLGYEWSGSTATGGDHNIYYLGDDEEIHRSGHQQIPDKPDTYTDRNPINQLWETYRGRRDVMAIPHWGGREANLDYFDAERIPLMEVHSNHGTFDFFLEDALKRKLKVGFVAGSDDHTCRLGLSGPSSNFGTRGGYVGAYASELTREALWEALWSRRCYATTGERMILGVDVDGHVMGEEYSTDAPPTVKVKVHGTCPLHEVEVKRGVETVYRHPFTEPKQGEDRLIKVEWSGVNTKARRIRMRVDWKGGLSLDRGRIVSFTEFAFDKSVLNDDPHGRDLHEGVESISERSLDWTSTTTGDPDGVVMRLDAPDDATVTFTSKPVTFSFKLKDVTGEPLVVPAGGANRVVKVSAISGELPSSLEFSFTDLEPMNGVNPYWVRVVQSDGGMGWSSPVYVDYTG